MTLGEFDELVAAVARRLRFERAVAAHWKWLVAVALSAGAGVLWAALAPAANPWLAVHVILAAALLFYAGPIAAAWLRWPVSALGAAAEIDRVAGLKERGSSVVAARCGAAPRTAAFPAMEADLATALAPVRREDVLRGLLPRISTPGKWLLASALVLMATLLVPARGARRGADLAAVLADGGEVLVAAQSAAESEPAGRPAGKAARQVLVLLKGPPPETPETAGRQKQSLEQLAAELRKSGSAADRRLAEQVEALARELSALAGAPVEGGAARGAPAAAEGAGGEGRYPEYAELLARYFAPPAGN